VSRGQGRSGVGRQEGERWEAATFGGVQRHGEWCFAHRLLSCGVLLQARDQIQPGRTPLCSWSDLYLGDLLSCWESWRVFRAGGWWERRAGAMLSGLWSAAPVKLDFIFACTAETLYDDAQGLRDFLRKPLSNGLFSTT